MTPRRGVKLCGLGVKVYVSRGAIVSTKLCGRRDGSAALAVLGAAAAHAAGVKHAEVAERGDEYKHADREADVPVGDGEVRIVAGAEPIKEQRHDADKGGQEEGGKTSSEAHQKRRKPAEIAERNSKENTLAAGPGDIVGTIHLN